MKAFLAFTAISAMLSGCASIIDGGDQQVTVVTASRTQPVQGSACTLSNTRGSWRVVSPGTTTIHRAQDALRVRCEAAGTARGTQVESETNGLVFGNILIGGLVGYMLDRSTGAAWQYPDRIAVEMGDMGIAGQAPAPSWTRTYADANATAYAAPIDTSAILLNRDGSAFVSGTRYIAPW